ncbi:MAG: stage III sporulation protein AC [Clostridia bacterium]|nr:stage III sporulation protein AC [Clostridia bacterium]
MDIDLVFRIAAFGIIISVMNQLLTRAGREDIATLATLAGLAVVMMFVVGLLSDFFSSVKQMFALY